VSDLCHTESMGNIRFSVGSTFWFAILCSFFSVAQAAQCQKEPKSRCKHLTDVAPIESVTASAGVFANLRKSKGSAKFETARLVTGALNELKKRAVDPVFTNSTEQLIILKSSPNKLLSDGPDREFCALAEKLTLAAPIRYPDRRFSSANDLYSWISDIQQGSGKDGKDLYKRCLKSCSPKVTYIVSQDGKAGALRATAEVVCGAARDKGENMYKISYGIKGQCLNH